MMTKVSVVIPLYNRAHSIGDAIQSVLQQTVPVHEIIVVDDASKDNSVDVVKALASVHPEITLIELQQNRGGGHARNVGIDAAMGEFVALLDSDDKWHPRKLEKQLAAMEGAADLICFTNIEVNTHDGRPPFPWNDRPFPYHGDVKKYKLELRQAIQTSSFLMPAATARRVRFNDNLRRNQDDDFVYRAALLGVHFVYVDELLVYYNADDSATRTSASRNFRPLMQWLDVAKEYLTEKERGSYYMSHIFLIHWKDNPLEAFRKASALLVAGHISLLSYVLAVGRRLVPRVLRRSS